jgi:hypothetical protein
MTHYAAYDDLSIYAVAETAEAAVAKARAETRDDATFSTAPISDELADWIEENGWHGPTRTFEIDRSGYLVDTTRGYYV